jgi:hypothetical protein
MSRVPMSLESLAEVDDGALGLLVKKALLNVCRDCIDRPTDATWRKVVLKIDFRPVANGPDLKHIEFVPEVVSKIPSYRTAPMIAAATMNGMTLPAPGEEADINDE